MEWRSRFALNGILVFIVCTVFISYLSFKRIIDPETWNALLWVILLFTATNAVAKSFIQDSPGRKLYYYSLIRPEVLILAKSVYNIFLMLVLTLFTVFFYSLFLGSLVEDLGLFFIAVLLGSSGFAVILTFISAIASKAQNANLVAILGFPVILPLLMASIKLSMNATAGINLPSTGNYIVILLALNVLALCMSFVLFPYLWRD